MNNLAIRLCGGTVLGALFGALCFYGFGTQPNLTPELKVLTVWSTSNFMMWDIIVNRAVVGFTVGLAGFLTIHPLFGFKLPAFFRGFAMGISATLTLALGILINGATPEAVTAFWMTLIAGGIIGLIIDVILTKIAGEGSDLK